MIWLLWLAVGCSGWFDLDGDGISAAYDCDDSNPDKSVGAIWYLDLDDDGYGENGSGVYACDPPPDYWPRAGDCNDFDAEIHRDADERCDGQDNDCDGITDEEPIDPFVWYPDSDSDGFGSDLNSYEACSPKNKGDLKEPGDCDDFDASVNPDTQEHYYDGLDANCDGLSDFDADLDGHDSDLYGGDDCDDDELATYPFATEMCSDGIDNDCDGADTACSLAGSQSLRIATTIFSSEEAGDGVGSSFALMDGGVAIGAPFVHNGFQNQGAVYFLEDPVVGYLLMPESALSMTHEQANARFGAAIVAVNDLWAVAAPGVGDELDERGAVYLLSTPVNSGDMIDPYLTLLGQARDDEAGATLLAIDLLADGDQTLVIGAPHGGDDEQGAIYLVSSGERDTLVLGDETTAWTGEFHSDLAGSSTAVTHDSNGDGLVELIVGAPGANDGAGSVYFFEQPQEENISLSEADARWTGPHGAYDDEVQGAVAGSAFGHSVASAGDSDGDGYEDLLIGAPLDSSHRLKGGGAWLFLGPFEGESSPSQAAAEFLSDGESESLGSSVLGAGDVNGDGYGEAVLGSPTASGEVQRSGRVGIYYGPLLGSYYAWEATTVLYGETSGVAAGTRLTSLGDINADGHADFAVGAGDALYFVFGAGDAAVHW